MRNNWKNKLSTVYGQQSLAGKQPWTVVYQPWLLVILLFVAGACHQSNDHASQDQYTCPMHPTVIQDKPGTCPVCGMDLVRKGKPAEEVKITAELNYLLKPANAIVISSIKTVMPVQRQMNASTTANGVITYDTRRFSSIPVRFGGRIEKLFIKYNFQPIRKGQKILEIYSPELVTAQRDLLYLLTSDKENTQLIESAKEKLRLLGLSDSQINQLISTRKESYSFGIFSPVDGYIVEDAVLATITASSQPAGASMNGGMAGNSSVKQTSNPIPTTELLTREGMYASSGQVIFKVVNTEQVWAEFNVYQKDAAIIKINEPIHLIFDNPSEEMEAKVNFIQPFFKDGESFSKVRAYLPNNNSRFQIGQLVMAAFTQSSEASQWIPITAKLELGTKEIVFIKRRGVFRPKEITTARQSGDWMEVTAGLEPDDSIAYNAQFMVDSESFIKVRN